MQGGAGNDVLFFDAADTSMLGGDGYDVAIVESAAGASLDLGASGIEQAKGNEGNDTFTHTNGSGSLAATSVTIFGNGGQDNISGGTANDYLNGGTGDDTIFGAAGEDTLLGGDGDDALAGSDGHDSLQGDAGNDTLQGDAGNDTLDGGAVPIR